MTTAASAGAYLLSAPVELEPNAGRQVRRAVEPRYERTLPAVACTPGLGAVRARCPGCACLALPRHADHPTWITFWSGSPRAERSMLCTASASVPDTFSAPDFNAHAMHWLHCSGGIGCCATHVGRAHSFWLATRAPSARAPSFAQAIVGTTVGAPAKVAKPQSTPGTTFSRPTSSA